jgi:PAS domain S-box-containing protein
MTKTKLYILLLEDDANDAELNKSQLELLEEYDCIVQWVDNKDSYLEALQLSNFDIVLSDYNLPSYNGLEALDDLRERNKLIPFIFVTGTIDEETAAGTIKAGAWDYVVKDRLLRLPLAIRSALQLREEKEINAKALAQNLILSKAIEQSPVHIIIHDINGKIEYVNARYTEVTGYAPDEVIGKSIIDVLPEINENEDAQEVWQNLKNGQSWRGESQSKRKDGSLFWESVSISPMKNENNEITHFISVKEDISARKLMEQALIEARDRSQKSEKLKDAFLQNLSHEIRTPLNAIVGFSELIKQPEDQTPENINEYTSIILDNSYQLLSIVSDILTVARIQTGQEDIVYRPLDICALMNRLYAVYEIKAQERKLELKLNIGIPNKEFITVTDETKLTQIITNLMNNALKFTNEGFIELGFIQKNKEILFYVKDTGIGIAKSSQEIIFERFRQAESIIGYNYGGTGLGLSISKSFSQMLGGRLWVESEPDKGATFFLSLPYYPDQILKSAEKTVNALVVDKEVKILIAEDEFYNYLLLKAFLATPNISLLHAQNGYEAVELFRQNPGIDLVLMDIKMPVMDGITAFDEIRKISADIPVIAQTAYALEQEKDQFLSRGFNDYIAKPIKKDELLEKINKILLGMK